ncbi:TIGR00304 family membrane protein [Methanolobus bombayensis]|jgi:uncharacterized protein (TIGR00304 family)|uniref:TIGR00304 family membrane protein n=1 Tax=Methanolobus bombayensis TaxID=38023 RepID=UPI001AE234D1|nr:DUF131 domain-containing protein [Methanolobus bombayensis]MBP1908232.1 uncharacterized protein (TIGR00304 family) [Methanolobus bombayensis]
MRLPQDLSQLGPILIFAGFFLVFAGAIVSSFNSKGSFGGLVMIGPIPIAFGSSPGITSSMLWAGVLIAVIYLLARRRF